MKKVFLAISLTIAVAAIASAQKASTRGSAATSSESSVRKEGGQIDLQSGTQLAAQLESALDVRHAKTGDRVVLKTTQAIKQNGQVVIQKGARLIGHVTDVQRQTKSTGESHIGLVFDRLRSGSTEIPITASILSITQARGRAQSGNSSMEADAMSQSSMNAGSSSRTSAGNGGLIGGVGNTVGGVLNTTTSTAGNVAGSATNAVGGTVGTTSATARNLTGSLNGLQINQSAGASAEGGSTLSLAGRDLRLESGATFNLSVSSSTTAGIAP